MLHSERNPKLDDFLYFCMWRLLNSHSYNYYVFSLESPYSMQHTNNTMFVFVHKDVSSYRSALK